MYPTIFKILIIGGERRISNIMKKWKFLTQSPVLLLEIGKIKIKVCLLSVKFKIFKYIVVNKVSKYSFTPDIPSC